MSSDTTAKRYNSILEIIDKRLVPDESAKKARGEVFTPLSLVREMLFGLRKSALGKDNTEIWGIDKNGNFFDDDESDRVGGIPLEVWRNPETKWLDPANGIGNFPVVAFYMLDYQLGKHGPKEFKGDNNKDKRRKHIVKNMLYMIEYNKGNVNTSRKIFAKIVPGVEANICCADTLKLTDEKLKSVFGVNRFDVIMGNPPFNPGPLWQKFVDWSLAKSIILLFLVPSNFTSNITGLKVIDKIKDTLFLIKFLERKDFNNQINIDTLYFYTNKEYNKGKVLINYLVEVDKNDPFVNYNNTIEGTIFNKLKNFKEHLNLLKGKNDTLNYENPKETDNIKFKKDSTHTHKLLSRLGGGEIEYYWVRKFVEEDTKEPKIVFPRGTASYNTLSNLLKLNKDIVYSTVVEGDTILSNGIMYLPIKTISEFENYRFYILRSKIIRLVFIRVNHLSELTKTIFNYIPRISPKDMKSDVLIYKAIGLTEKEINYIDNFFVKNNVTKPEQKTAKASKPKKGGTHRFNTTRKNRLS